MSATESRFDRIATLPDRPTSSTAVAAPAQPVVVAGEDAPGPDATRDVHLVTDYKRWIPYLILHGACLGVFWVGWSWVAVTVALLTYLARTVAITGVYHRYFSHRAYRLNRFWQFVFALWGNTAAQRGPMWWAAQHRHHHAHSDEPEDYHSPKQHGLYWAHMGWLTAKDTLVRTDYKLVPDLAKYPELRWLDRFEFVVPTLLAIALFGLGYALDAAWPSLGTSGLQMLVWGFFISTVALFHATSCINSLAHLLGSTRFETTDTSRNNWFLALMTMGEGWHNNHHRYPSAARQGFYWWEIDVTYYLLRGFEKLGIISDLRAVPETILEEGRRRDAA